MQRKLRFLGTFLRFKNIWHASTYMFESIQRTSLFVRIKWPLNNSPNIKRYLLKIGEAQPFNRIEVFEKSFVKSLNF